MCHNRRVGSSLSNERKILLSEVSRQGSGEQSRWLGRKQRAITPEELVRQYGPAVRAICLANSRNVDDAEDVAQEALLRAVSSLHTLKDERAARRWVVRIARNTCVDYYRKMRKTAALDENVAAQTKDVDMVNNLHKAVAALPRKYKEVITLYYMDGRKCDSVAQLLHIKPAAVRKRLARARLMLHEALREEAT